MFNSPNARFTSCKLEPFDEVFAKIVCTAFIWVSYSENPVLIGSMVRADIIFLPVVIAALVIRTIAVTPAISNAENLSRTTSIPLVNGLKFIPLMPELIFSRPLDAPSNLRACLSLSRVLILVLTLLSKSRFSKPMETTRSSTVLPIAYLLPSI